MPADQVTLIAPSASVTKRSYVCLVTNELYPITHGGCGTFLANSIVELLGRGQPVLVLADLSAADLAKFRRALALPAEQDRLLELVCVEECLVRGCGDQSFPVADTPLRLSWRYWQALRLVRSSFAISLVEFPDYKGWAYFSILDALGPSRAQSSPVVVRYHLPIEEIESITPTGVMDQSRFAMFQQERQCLSLADAVLFSSEAIRREALEFYRGTLSQETTVISRPSFAAWGLAQRRPKADGQRQKVLFFSRLAPQKGADLFVEAAIRLLSSGKGEGIEFVVAGPDMMQAPTGGSMIDYLSSIIPARFRKQFTFTGNLDREALQDLLPAALFAVVPSRSETYCYAVRELMMAGVPTIISSIPAFEDLKAADAALSVDLNAEAIAEGMQALLEDTTLRKKYEISWQPPEPLGHIYAEGRPAGPAPVDHCLGLDVLILASSRDAVQPDCPSVLAARAASARVIAAFPSRTGRFMLFGRLCELMDLDTRAYLHDFETAEVLCVLMAGDEVPADYLSSAMEMLQSNARLAAVGADPVPVGEGGDIWDRLPWDAVPEFMPFLKSAMLFRCVTKGDRIPLTKRLPAQLFDLQEIHAIWSARARGGALARMPGVAINISLSEEEQWSGGIDPTLRMIGLRTLIDRFIEMPGRLRVAKGVQALASYELQGAQGGAFNRDVLSAVSQGYIPEVLGLRLNMQNLALIMRARLAYLRSIRPRTVPGYVHTLKAIFQRIKFG
ncbi:glycosyltransferase family 4 protein [Croceicoccus mobilis]|uniref:Glycosyl transferase family 1 domain-containing protein n=1 Tax=Croceicoccus mobilis TaxID=1703339 RepID=A0A916YYV3_9SPHN|nr:glycosyltransferase family 4 protein [Croceicoccus mobilis]GGD67668.1 hypothetical protein GCM10010990_16460 [Croceicoccus mobilis]